MSNRLCCISNILLLTGGQLSVIIQQDEKLHVQAFTSSDNMSFSSLLEVNQSSFFTEWLTDSKDMIYKIRMLARVVPYACDAQKQDSLDLPAVVLL